MKSKKIRLMMIAIASICLFSGCAHKDILLPSVKKTEYSKLEYRTCEVVKGEFVPGIKLTLQDENYEKIEYKMQKEELELDTLHVAVGDRVKKGDVLVSFKSDEIEKELNDYIEQKNSTKLLIEHYKNLMKADKSLDYKSEIRMLSEDMAVSDLYIEEITEILKGYTIRAKRKGVITNIDECLLNGYYEPSGNLVTEVCSTGKYSVTVADDSLYKLGEVYNGYAGSINCRLKLIKKKNGSLLFKTMEDVSALLETSVMEVEISKDVIEDAIYIETSALYQNQNQYFVYVVDEDGFREKRDVVPGETYSGYTIINEGLNPGEKVAY